MTENDIRKVEQFFNGMRDHARQATQCEPMFRNQGRRMFQANRKLLAKALKVTLEEVITREE